MTDPDRKPDIIPSHLQPYYHQPSLPGFLPSQPPSSWGPRQGVGLGRVQPLAPPANTAVDAPDPDHQNTTHPDPPWPKDPIRCTHCCQPVTPIYHPRRQLWLCPLCHNCIAYFPF